MGDIVMESLYLQPVTCEEISKLFVGLKNTAFGLDGIGAISFKTIFPVYHTATRFIM